MTRDDLLPEGHPLKRRSDRPVGTIKPTLGYLLPDDNAPLNDHGTQSHRGPLALNEWYVWRDKDGELLMVGMDAEMGHFAAATLTREFCTCPLACTIHADRRLSFTPLEYARHLLAYFAGGVLVATAAAILVNWMRG